MQMLETCSRGRIWGLFELDNKILHRVLERIFTTVCELSPSHQSKQLLPKRIPFSCYHVTSSGFRVATITRAPPPTSVYFSAIVTDVLGNIHGLYDLQNTCRTELNFMVFPLFQSCLREFHTWSVGRRMDKT